ncbi:MAG: class I SAM-dependent RNA methyltransferase [Tunicatimonas sp.]
MTKSTIIVTCAPHTSDFLADELRELGFPVLAQHALDVETEGTLDDCLRLNLYLRTAHRVHYLLKSFRAYQTDQLYRKVKQVVWEDYIPADSYLSVTSFVRTPSVRDHRFANVRVKDAVVDRLQDHYGRRPDSGPRTDRIVLFLYWKDTHASLYLDTSGESLTRHGYRQVSVEAPMQESLAAVIIQASTWHPRQAFINPMCGSGTLAIEAALLRINRPPGLLRTNYAFMHLKTFVAARWEELRKEAQQAEVADVANLSPIVATDHDPEAIAAARQNAAAAGVEHLIQFETIDFAQTLVPAATESAAAPGKPVAGKPVIMVNPPYGSRLGEEEELKKLYAALGDFFKQRGAGYHAYIFTGNLALAKHVGLRTKSRTELYNGKLESRLLEYELYTGTR